MCLDFPAMPDKLTQAEERILNYIEENRESFLFLSIGQLAQMLHVSEATVSRFARRMGCQDYKQLKQIVQQQRQLEGPAGKLAGTLMGEEAFSPMQYLRYQQLCLERTLEHLDEGQFQNAVDSILTARRVFLLGKRASQSMSQLLYFRLRRMGIQVSQLSSGTELLEGLAQAGKGDLVILFAFSKLSREGRIIQELRKEAGYTTLIFTGRLHVPEEERGDGELYIYRGQEQEYHSMTAAAAVIDSLVVALSQQMGPESADCLKRMHQLKKRYPL